MPKRAPPACTRAPRVLRINAGEKCAHAPPPRARFPPTHLLLGRRGAASQILQHGACMHDIARVQVGAQGLFTHQRRAQKRERASERATAQPSSSLLRPPDLDTSHFLSVCLILSCLSSSLKKASCFLIASCMCMVAVGVRAWVCARCACLLARCVHTVLCVCGRARAHNSL